MRHGLSLALTLAAALTAQAQEAAPQATPQPHAAPDSQVEEETRYDASGAWEPIAGAKLRTDRGGHVAAEFVVRRNGKVEQKEDGYQEYFHHRYLSELQAVDEGKLTRSLRTYEVVKDSLYPHGKLDVRGMQVLVVHEPTGGLRLLGPTGDPPKGVKEQALHRTIQGESQRGLPTTDRVLKVMLPREPLRVGDAWQVPAGEVLQFFDPSAVEEPDPKAVVTCGGVLEEVIEQEDGPTLLRLSIEVHLLLDRVLFMAFEQPARLQLTGELVVAADGASPHRDVKVEGTFVGKGKAGAYEQDFDVSLSLEEQVRVVGALPAKPEPAPAPAPEPAPRRHYY